jgi:hypothetical protein
MRTLLPLVCLLHLACTGGSKTPSDSGGGSTDTGTTGGDGGSGDGGSGDGGTSDGGTGDGGSGSGDGGSGDGGDTGKVPLGGCVDGAAADVESVAVAEAGMDFSVVGALEWVTGHYNGDATMSDGEVERGSLSVTSFGEGAQVVFPTWEGEVEDSGTAPLCPPAYLIPFEGTLYLGNSGEVAETFEATLRAARVDTAEFELRIALDALTGNSIPTFDTSTVEETVFTTLAKVESRAWRGDAFWIGGSDGKPPVYSELVASYSFVALEAARRPAPRGGHFAAFLPQ